ncbi:MAG: zinc transport system permease protein [Oceanicoccus sp.]
MTDSFTTMIMLEIFQYEFMQRAFIAGLLISILTPMLGAFIVARKASLLSDTFAHTALAGVGLGLLLDFNPILGAAGVAVIASLGIERIIEKSKLSNDAIQAIFLSGGLALAVLLTHLQDSATIGFKAYLFGSILTVTWVEVWLLLGALVGMSLVIYKSYWPLLLISVNEPLAKAKGIKTNFYKTLLSLLTALIVSLSLKIVGALLIGALIVLPVLTAAQFAKSFKQTLIGSVISSIVFVFTGLILSYFLDVPSGSAIVLFSIACFILSLLMKNIVK